MAARVRSTGEILCAAKHPEMPGDLYLDDLIQSLLIGLGVIRTEDGGGRWMIADPRKWSTTAPQTVQILQEKVAAKEARENDPHSVEVALTPKMAEHLEDLVEGGFHGDNINQAATRLLAKQMEASPQAGNGNGRAIGFGKPRARDQYGRDWPRHINPKGEQ